MDYSQMSREELIGVVLLQQRQLANAQARVRQLETRLGDRAPRVELPAETYARQVGLI